MYISRQNRIRAESDVEEREYPGGIEYTTRCILRSNPYLPTPSYKNQYNIGTAPPERERER